METTKKKRDQVLTAPARFLSRPDYPDRKVLSPFDERQPGCVDKTVTDDQKKTYVTREREHSIYMLGFRKVGQLDDEQIVWS
jgi:hypothetical protein